MEGLISKNPKKQYRKFPFLLPFIFFHFRPLAVSWGGECRAKGKEREREKSSAETGRTCRKIEIRAELTILDRF